MKRRVWQEEENTFPECRLRIWVSRAPSGVGGIPRRMVCWWGRRCLVSRRAGDHIPRETSGQGPRSRGNFQGEGS